MSGIINKVSLKYTRKGLNALVAREYTVHFSNILCDVVSLEGYRILIVCNCLFLVSL